MKKTFMHKCAILFLSMLLPVVAIAQGITGAWTGILDAGGTKLNIVFHINTDKTVTMDSPDQGAMGIPATVNCLADDTVSVEFPALRAQYSGKLSGSEIHGTFSQMGYTFPLNLKRGEVKLNRPQTPQPPFAYETREVSFENNGIDQSTGKTTGSVRLAGTLTYPENFRKGMPVVLMVTGSGQQNRDEELMGHKPFLVIADYLARHGIATLRYDDRGVGKSTGDASAVIVRSNMLDAQAGMEFLKKCGEFGKIGVLGHSEGGMIGYMLAARGEADFVVSLAGPALPGDSLLMMQNRDLLTAAGLDEVNTSNYVAAMKRIFDFKKSGRTMKFAATPESLVPMLTSDIDLLPQLRQNLIETVKQLDTPWLASYIKYDPSADVAKMTCPVMLIGGERDMQVNTEANIKALRAHVPASIQPRSLFKSYPRLNHLFQPSESGLPLEYGKIETTISEEVLSDIAKWINGLCR